MKRKILKIIAFINVYIIGHFDLAREARLSIIAYSMQKLTNPYTEINTNINKNENSKI